MEMKSTVRQLLPLLQEGWSWHHDGKLRRMDGGQAVDQPWIYQNLTFQCVLWHKAFFELISGKTMVHSHCQDCYKVVIRPRSVQELIALEQWQATLDVPCKCGIELREFVPALYGGYFYCRGVEEGRERYREVKRFAYEAAQAFGLPTEQAMPVILKLGCSEFERAIGPSDKYTVTEDQKRLEEWVTEHIDFDPFGSWGHSEVLKESLRMSWLKWAHANGDMSYVSFMPDKQPFEKGFVTYHEEEDDGSK